MTPMRRGSGSHPRLLASSPQTESVVEGRPRRSLCRPNSPRALRLGRPAMADEIRAWDIDVMPT